MLRYASGSKLAGIIYIHRISDDRFTGISVRNFKMFRNLCGESTLKNVVLVTNMWGRVEKNIGEAREKELADVYFKLALEKGAQLARHHDTTLSAYEIIRRIMKNDPAPLLIQRELVDERKDIKRTAAGGAVNEELNEVIKRHEAEMNALREEMRVALKEKDEWMKRVLEEETFKIQTQMVKMMEDSEAMATKYDEERRKAENRIKQMQEQARKERQRIHENHVKEINDLKDELGKNTSATAEEREAMLKRIHELESKLNSRPGWKAGSGCIVI